MKKRIEWIDIFKYFCIIGVMSEHAPSFNGLVDAINAPFYLNGFFFAAGYLYTHREGFWNFLKRKSKQLLIPWLFFSLFIIFSAQIFSFNEHVDLKTALINNFLQIRLQGDEMWFVSALFVCFIPFYFLIKWYKSKTDIDRKTLVITLITMFLLSKFFYTFSETSYIGGVSHRYVWHLEYIPRGMFLMFLGYLFRDRWEGKFDILNTWQMKIPLWIIFFVIALTPQLSHHVFSMHGQIAYRYVSSFVGMISVIALSKTITPNRYMRFVGENTITYYGLHGKFQSAVGTFLFKFAGPVYWDLCWGYELSSKALYGGAMLSYGFALLSSVALIIPAYLMAKYTPVLVGKPSKSKITEALRNRISVKN